MPYRAHDRLRGIGYVVLAAAAVAAVLVAVLVIGRHDDEPGYQPPAGAGHVTDGSAGRDGDRAARRDHRRGGGPSSPGSGGPGWFAGLPLSGDVSAGPHEAVISVTTAAGTAVGVKYAFRTGSGVDSGLTTAVSSWTASETVRGGEPLAGVIAQVADGTVSCTVRIDGQVTSHRTGSGHYATVTCAG